MLNISNMHYSYFIQRKKCLYLFMPLLEIYKQNVTFILVTDNSSGNRKLRLERK